MVTPTSPRIPALSEALEQIRQEEKITTDALMESLQEDHARHDAEKQYRCPTTDYW
jgi:hypothetical protein